MLVCYTVAADDTNYLRELYSSDSVCLRHKEKWTLQRPGALTKQLPSRFGGGCYKVCSCPLPVFCLVTLALVSPPLGIILNLATDY